MKTIKLLLVNILLGLLLPVSSVGQTYTNGVYLENGKTVEIDKSIHEIIPTNSPEILYFSNELIVKVNTNSDFAINSFYQNLLNTNSQPEKIKSDSHNFSSTLSKGSIIVTYAGGNENSSCVISTPFTDHELSKGTFYFEVGENNVMVIVLDGSLKSYSDGKSRTVTTTTGNAMIAVLTDSRILESKVSLYEDKVQKSVINKLTTESKDVTNLKTSTVFIRINGKIVGVLL